MSVSQCSDVLNGWPHDHDPTSVGAMVEIPHTGDTDSLEVCGLGGYSRVSGGGRGGLDAGVKAGVPGEDPGVQECTVHHCIHIQCVQVG